MSNVIPYEWGAILCSLVGNMPAVAYIEFENNGGANVTPPTLDRSGGRAYYAGLLTHPTRDYLRVPILAVQQSTTDAINAPDGNTLRLLAQTTGTVGVGGKPFSAASHSRVYGIAVVFAPAVADASQDLVLYRNYYDVSEQMTKLSSAPLIATAQITFD